VIEKRRATRKGGGGWGPLRGSGKFIPDPPRGFPPSPLTRKRGRREGKGERGPGGGVRGSTYPALPEGVTHPQRGEPKT